MYIAIDMMGEYLRRMGISLVEQGTRTVAEEQYIANSVESKEEEVLKYRAI